MGTGLLSVTASLAAAVLLKKIPLNKMISDFLATLGGASWTFWRSYKGYSMQMHVTATFILAHEKFLRAWV